MTAPDAPNVAALRRVYEEWGRGNWRAGPEVYGEDMEWTMWAGKASRLQVFSDRRKALKAAGLDPGE